MEPDYVSRVNADKSVVVWVGGWRVHFPPEGDPTAERSMPPEEVKAKAGVGEMVRAIGKNIGVGCHGRLVLLRPDEAVVLPEGEEPKKAVDQRWRVRYMDG